MRRLLVVFVCLLVVAAVLLGGLWFWLAGRLEQVIAETTAFHRAQGYEVSYELGEASGLPFAMRRSAAAPSIASPDGWRWQGPSLEGEAELFRPLELRLDYPGRHEIVPPAETGLASLSVDTETATGLVELGLDGGVAAVSTEVSGLSADTAAWGQVTADTLTARVAPLAAPQGATAADGPEPRHAVSLALSDLRLPADSRPLLGHNITRLGFEGTIFGLPPEAPPAEALQAWRQAGGKMAVEQLDLAWGALVASGNGTLGLDEALRPAGLLDAEVAGLPQLVDLLVDEGRLDEAAGLGIKLGLMVLPGRNDSAGRRLLRVPVRLEGGTLFLGPLPLARLEPVVREGALQ